MDISVRAAVTLDLSYGGMHFLWARNGLQMLLGKRGQLFPVLSLSEAANFQSNLYENRCQQKTFGRVKIVSQNDNQTFIQLYAAIIYQRPDRPRLNPVSGSIVCDSLLHHQSTQKLCDCAESESESEDYEGQLLKTG